MYGGAMKYKNEKFYGWTALSGGALSVFIAGGAGYTFSAFLPALNKEFGWRAGEISMALFLASVLMTLAGPGAGLFIKRFGARLAVILGNALITIAFFMLAFHQRQWQLHVAYSILGIGSGIGGIIAAGTIATSWFLKKTPLAMAVNMGAMGIGGLIFAPATAVLIQAMSWRQTYMVLGAVTLLVGAIVPGILVRNKPEDLGQVPDGIAMAQTTEQASVQHSSSQTSADFTLKQAARTSAFWLLGLYSWTPFFIMVFLMAHQINFLKGVGLSSETAGLALGVVSATSVFGTLITGVLGLRFDVRKLTVVAMVLVILSMIISLATHSAALAFIYSAIFGVALGATMVSLMSLMPAYFGRAHFSTIIGACGLFVLFSGFGAPIGGFIFDATKSYNLAFLVNVGIGLLGLIFLLLVRPPVHPSMKTAKD
jgi:MFS family permease